MFWRSTYGADENDLTSFDTKDTIEFSRYDYFGGSWSEAKEVYNGSLGSVKGMQAAMIHGGNAIVVFVLDRDPENDSSADCEIAYRVVYADNTMSDLVVLTNDQVTDGNPLVAAATKSGNSFFVLGWYSDQDGGDIRLQAVGANGQLYSGASDYAVPASVKSAIDESQIPSGFSFVKATFTSMGELTLVWAKTEAKNGQADHSVLYGIRFCDIDGKICLSDPQALITLPDRTLANSFTAWRSGQNGVNAYIFGTWYDPENTEQIDGYQVPLDTDSSTTSTTTMPPIPATASKLSPVKPPDASRPIQGRPAARCLRTPRRQAARSGWRKRFGAPSATPSPSVFSAKTVMM